MIWSHKTAAEMLQSNPAKLRLEKRIDHGCYWWLRNIETGYVEYMTVDAGNDVTQMLDLERDEPRCRDHRLSMKLKEANDA